MKYEEIKLIVDNLINVSKLLESEYKSISNLILSVCEVLVDLVEKNSQTNKNIQPQKQNNSKLNFKPLEINTQNKNLKTTDELDKEIDKIVAEIKEELEKE